jgi:hypothetical protein
MQTVSKSEERKVNRYVVGLNGTAFIGMCEVGHPGCFGASGAEYVMACDHEREMERLRNEVNELRTANAIWEQTNAR